MGFKVGAECFIGWRVGKTNIPPLECTFVLLAGDIGPLRIAAERLPPTWLRMIDPDDDADCIDEVFDIVDPESVRVEGYAIDHHGPLGIGPL